MKKLLPLLCACAALLAIGAGSASAATIVNGDFESGDTSGWTIVHDSGGAGSWTTYDQADTAGDVGLNAPYGQSSALSMQYEISDAAMYQDVALAPGESHVLNLNYWVKNYQPAWLTPDPESFDVETAAGAIQTARIDVIKPTADPLSADPADVLATVFKPQVGSPLQLPWTAGSADLSAFAGQTVRLRALFSVTQNAISLGLDNVSITSKDNVAPVTSRGSV
ncbi:MAG: hypothetical protein QM648_00005 [Solirubrobacterales bacterium]